MEGKEAEKKSIELLNSIKEKSDKFWEEEEDFYLTVENEFIK